MSTRAKLAFGIVGALTALVVGAWGWVSHSWNSRRYRSWEVSAPPVEVRYDAATIARGEHLALHMLGCAECHGDDFGGRTFIDDPSGIGVFSGCNLTRGEGGRGPYLGEEDWARAVIRGVGDSHHALVIMPSPDYQDLAAEDLAAVIAYGRTRPDVDRTIRVAEPTFLGKLLTAVGALPTFPAEENDMDHALRHGVPTGRTLEQGAYVANACIGCHRHDLVGGPFAATPAGCPAPANLTRLDEDGYTEAEFMRLFREGRAHDGHELHTFMPWEVLGGMTDEELGALWDYLRQLPPQPTGR
ncbi:MAG: cytochrome c [Sandaracinaceae bacterium]|nr:cytochrome c [Sandaracinaceae bacterium]